MREKRKPAFMVNDDMCETFLNLPKEQAALLMKGLCEFHLRDEPVVFADPVLNAVYAGYVARMKTEQDNYIAVCKKNEENGKKGGRPKKATG